MSDYSSQTVASLKEVLKSRGLAVDGKKADLVQRLTEHDAQNGGENSTAGDSLSDSIKFNKKHSQKKGFKNRNKKNKKGGK